MTLEYKTIYEDLTSFCLGMIEYIIIERYNVPKENLQVKVLETCSNVLMDRMNQTFWFCNARIGTVK